ncbi:hypothetical protein VNO77_34738 [Canavalia gladiata]|uniref:Uncharacterized protein n=1 Tax=Canavalia gladiata TaxID=3824 RepID=A0AAN9KEL4_CANGL
MVGTGIRRRVIEACRGRPFTGYKAAVMAESITNACISLWLSHRLTSLTCPLAHNRVDGAPILSLAIRKVSFHQFTSRALCNQCIVESLQLDQGNTKHLGTLHKSRSRINLQKFAQSNITHCRTELCLRLKSPCSMCGSLGYSCDIPGLNLPKLIVPNLHSTTLPSSISDFPIQILVASNSVMISQRRIGAKNPTSRGFYNLAAVVNAGWPELLTHGDKFGLV